MPAAHIQTESNVVLGGVTSISKTLTLTAGNGVVVNVLVLNHSSGGAGPITQTSGDTVVLKASIDDGGSYTVQYANASVSGGSTTFTFTTGNASDLVLFVSEFSSASDFDVSASTTQTIANSHSSGTTATLAQADSFAVAVWNGDGSSGKAFDSITNGFTVPTNGDVLATGVSLVAYKVLAATTAVETTMSVIVGGSYAATGLIGVYKAAAAAGGQRFLLVRN